MVRLIQPVRCDARRGAKVAAERTAAAVFRTIKAREDETRQCERILIVPVVDTRLSQTH